jgi:hypothetical protein
MDAPYADKKLKKAVVVSAGEENLLLPQSQALQ